MSNNAHIWASNVAISHDEGKSVLKQLAWHAAERSGAMYIGTARLAEACGISEKTARRHLQALEGAGLILRYRRHVSSSQGRAVSGYVLAGWLAYLGARLPDEATLMRDMHCDGVSLESELPYGLEVPMLRMPSYRMAVITLELPSDCGQPPPETVSHSGLIEEGSSLTLAGYEDGTVQCLPVTATGSSTSLGNVYRSRCPALTDNVTGKGKSSLYIYLIHHYSIDSHFDKRHADDDGLEPKAQEPKDENPLMLSLRTRASHNTPPQGDSSAPSEQSSAGASETSRPSKAARELEEAWQVVRAYNDNRGSLPAITKLEPSQKLYRDIRALVRRLGLETARDEIECATIEVRRNPYYLQKRYGLRNLLAGANYEKHAAITRAKRTAATQTMTHHAGTFMEIIEESG